METPTLCLVPTVNIQRCRTLDQTVPSPGTHSIRHQIALHSSGCNKHSLLSGGNDYSFQYDDNNKQLLMKVNQNKNDLVEKVYKGSSEKDWAGAELHTIRDACDDGVTGVELSDRCPAYSVHTD
ncbi:hypothetical protein F2P81_013431 [Scophthalmus maximus]|uniref:Uncharacterized protein n=1 Tax=Scophthalmus maximus TaxID=52904 RepID=A0A6A4SLE1_SCOMX|nr:hypothetical protein F2P81_013431 [Scophthalmus maximus]